jgi:hypothetical protein
MLRFMTSEEDKLRTEIDQVLQSENVIKESCRKFSTAISPAVNAISINVEISFPGRQMILRCIIKRLKENLEMIIDATESKNPHMSTMILRPLSEDLIYGTWLRTLPEDAANKLVTLSMQADITKNIIAQTKFLPKAYARLGPLPDGTMGQTLTNIMEAGGFGLDPGQSETRLDRIKEELKKLGVELGWPKGKIPSVYDMANQTDLSEIYEFFYHGSSKAVHANLHNMSRMVWGNPKTHIFTIDSHHFENYFVNYALTYGIWLASETMERIAKHEFPEEFRLIDEEACSVWLALVLAGLARNGKLPPLVTREELWWPTEQQ